jgi:O-antigen ligase
MRLGKFQEVVLSFAATFIAFIALSVLLRGHPEFASNLCFALVFTLIFAIRDELKPATQYVFNLVWYGMMIAISAIAFFFTTNTPSDQVVECLVFLYGSYLFYKEYKGNGR